MPLAPHRRQVQLQAFHSRVLPRLVAVAVVPSSRRCACCVGGASLLLQRRRRRPAAAPGQRYRLCQDLRQLLDPGPSHQEGRCESVLVFVSSYSRVGARLLLSSVDDGDAVHPRPSRCLNLLCLAHPCPAEPQRCGHAEQDGAGRSGRVQREEGAVFTPLNGVCKGQRSGATESLRAEVRCGCLLELCSVRSGWREPKTGGPANCVQRVMLFRKVQP